MAYKTKIQRIFKYFLKASKYVSGFGVAAMLFIAIGIFWAWGTKLNTDTVDIFPTEYELEGSAWTGGQNMLTLDLEEDAVSEDFNEENSAIPEGEGTIALHSFDLSELRSSLDTSQKLLSISDLSLMLSFAAPEDVEGRLLLEVSIDGESRYEVAEIDQNSYYSNSINGGYYSFPLDVLFGELNGKVTSADVESLQLFATYNNTAEDPEPLYIDSIWLSMEFDISNPSVSRPKVKLKKGEHVLAKKTTFSSAEEPVMTFTNPQLVLDDLKSMAERNELDIIEDKFRTLTKKNIVFEMLKEVKDEEVEKETEAEKLIEKIEDGLEKLQKEEEGEKDEDKEAEEEEDENLLKKAEEVIKDSDSIDNSDNVDNVDNSDNVTESEELEMEKEVKDKKEIEEKPQDEGSQKEELKEETDNEEDVITEDESDKDDNPDDAGGQQKEKESQTSLNSLFVKEARAQGASVQDISFYLVDPRGDRGPVDAKVSRYFDNSQEKFDVQIQKPERNFIPGKYTLEAELKTQESIVVLQQDFEWGVLAVNFNKSIYTTNDTLSYVQMGVLDDKGHTLCDVELELKVTTPNNKISFFSTEDGTIRKSNLCRGDSFSPEPDYFVNYRLEGRIGTYEVELTATTENGTRSVADNFKVVETVPFDVERQGPTRIYPPELYEMSFTVVADQDFEGEIVETVPYGFVIPESEEYVVRSMEEDNKKEIVWPADIKTGDIMELSYKFDAPNISPEFYLLGPLEFVADGSIFSEARRWQIASDAPLPTLLVSGNGTGPRNWVSQNFADIDEGISGSDGGAEISAATGNGNRNTSLDTSFTIDPTPSDFLTMDDISYNVRYRANSNVGDDTLTFGIRIVNGATILAAADAGGAFQTVQTGQNTTWSTTLNPSGETLFSFVNTTADKTAWDGAEVELRSTHAANMGPEDNWVIVDTLEFTGNYTQAVTGIDISGSTDAGDGATVSVAVNGTRQAETGTTSGGSWTISNVPEPNIGDVVTVWIDDAVEAAESTGVTLYSGAGQVTGLQLDANVLSIGTTGAYADQSLTVGDLAFYDSDSGSDGGDEDVMHTSNSDVLNVEASGNSYTNETIRIEAGDTLTIGGTETLNAHNVQIDGTLSSGGAGTFNITGNWTNNSIFQSNSETITFSGAASASIDAGCTAYNDCASGSFNNIEINKTDADEANDNITLVNSDLNIANTITITDGEFVQGALNVQAEGTTTAVSVASAGEWFNVSTGGLYLDGDFINNGSVTFNANGLTCGDADDITIDQVAGSANPLPDWDGTGTFTIKDVTISNQNAVASTTVEDSTNGGNNTGNFTFSGCSVTVSGSILQDDESTFIGDPPCNGSTQAVSLRINGGAEQTEVCDADGYTFSGLFPAAGDTITVYLNSNSTPKANLVLVAGSSDVLDADLYQDTVMVRDEDDGTINILDVVDWDSSTEAGSDMLFDAVSGTPDSLTVGSGAELHVWGGTTFQPGGDVATTSSGDQATNAGDLHIATSAMLGMEANSLSVGGDFENQGTFSKSATQTTTFTATATGHTITDGGNNFENVVFNGTGGGWSFADSTVVDNDLTVTDGTLSGANDITVIGSVTGNGTINFSAGVFEQRVSAAENFGASGGSNNWTFNDLIFSNADGAASHVISVQTGATGAVVVNGVMLISNTGDTQGTTLDAGDKTYTLAGTGGDPLNTDLAGGTLNGQNSTFEYTGDNAGGDTNIEDVSYNNLTLGGASAENYESTEGAFSISGDLTVDTNATLIGTNDITVNGSVSGAGTIDISGGLFTQRVSQDRNFGSSGGSNNWTFNDLTFSNSNTDGTTDVTISTNAGTGQIIVDQTLTVGGAGDTGGNGTFFDNENFNDRILDIHHVTINPQGILTASSTALFTVSGNWTNNGALNEGTGTIEFDGTTSAQIDPGCTDVDNCTSENFNSIEISKISGTDADDNITLVNSHLRLSGTLTITDGELIQGAQNVRAEGATAVSVSTGNGAAWTNTSSGNLILGGSFDAGDGSITFQGGGVSCGDFDSIEISSTDSPTGTQRSWTDSGATFNFNDVNVQDQGGTASITVEDGTDGGGNDTNWNFVDCPGSGTSTFSMRPDGDVPTMNWAVTGSTCAGEHWCTVNDNFDEPDQPDFTDFISASGNTGADRFTTTSPTDVDTATQIIPKVFMDATGGNNNMQVSVAVFINGSQVGTTFACPNATATPTWCSGDPISGTWSQQDIETLEIELTASKGGGQADTVRVSATYAELTYTPTGITVEGNIFEDESATALVACDGATNMIAVRVGGTTYGPATCADGSGFFSINAITQPATGTPIFIYPSGCSTGCGDEASAVFATTVIRYGGSGSINNAVARRDRLILRHDDGGPVDNTDLDAWDNANDSDIVYNVDDATDELVVEDGIKLIINAFSNFTPGANVETSASNDGTNSVIDGDILIQTSATMGMQTNTLSVGGDFENAGTFSKSATQTTIFTATATGHTITDGGNNFENIVFNGTNGGWSFADSTVVDGDITMTAGELSGTNDITVNGGDVTGAGTINLTGGTFTVANSDGTANLGGGSYTFNNLTIGDGDGSSETTQLAGDVTVSNTLTIATNDTLDGSNDTITLNGTGTPFVISGSFDQNTSTVAYKGEGATDIASASYWNLESSPAADSVTHQLGTASSQNFIINNRLSVGNGTNTTTLDLDNYNPSLNLNGTLEINASATFLASASATFSVGGDFTNNGIFTHNGGEITFDGAGTSDITGDGTIFNDFTSTINNKALRFGANENFQIDGLLTLGTAGGNQVTVDSDDGVSQWLINHQGTEDINNTTISNSGCHASSTEIDAFTANGNVDDGNNDSCWVFTEFIPASQNWQWFDDGGSSLAGENSAPSNVANDTLVKLRFTIAETNGGAATDIRYKIQFSTQSDFSSGVTDVAEIGGTCTGSSQWCYADGTGDDDTLISGLNLTDSDTRGTHNESGTTASTFDHQAREAVEFEFSIKSSGPQANTTYFFRAYDTKNDQSVAFNTGEAHPENYPSLSTAGTSLDFSISGLPASTSTEGVTTDVATTATEINFGAPAFETHVSAAHRVSITTNANSGYSLYVYERSGFLGDTGAQINPIAGTNSDPVDWDNGCSGLAGCYGYHTGDDSLSSNPLRFSPDDTYAAFSTSPEEVAFNPGSVTGEEHDMVYRLEVSKLQEAGNYSNNIVYIVVPVF